MLAGEDPVAELAADGEDFPEEAGVDEVFQLHEAGQPELVLHDAVLEAGGGDLLGEGEGLGGGGAAGYDEAGSGGAGLIMLELEVRYAAQAFWGDRLCVDMAVAGLGAARCEFRYRVGRAGQEVLRARTLMGFFDYAARRPVRRPADFLTRLMALNEDTDDV